jgi:DDE_Tnp_1-associated/Transposase DDE domain
MLLKYLEKIPDHRRGQARKYLLSYVLLFAVFGILSGARSYRDMTRFMGKRLRELNNLFGVNWKSAPSKTQIRDIIANTNKEAVEEVFREYGKEVHQCKLGKGTGSIGLDGKALRGSFDNAKEQNMLQMLSAFCAKTKIILGHVDIDEKTNEIPTAQQLIKELGLPEGTVYTADAMHCQKKHLKQLRKSKEN